MPSALVHSGYERLVEGCRDADDVDGSDFVGGDVVEGRVIGEGEVLP